MVRATCPVRGALGGNLLLRGSKAPSFDSIISWGLDHGAGHSLLLLYDANTSRGQKIKQFNGLGDDPFNASISLF